jgi:hypothetical protein
MEELRRSLFHGSDEGNRPHQDREAQMEPAYHVTITHEGRTWEVVVPAETPGQAEDKARARYGIHDGRVQAGPRLSPSELFGYRLITHALGAGRFH